MTVQRPVSVWTPEMIETLRYLWEVEQLPTIEIGRRLGISKNAVVGKAHRVPLSPRTSPIRRDPEPAREQVDAMARLPVPKPPIKPAPQPAGKVRVAPERTAPPDVRPVVQPPAPHRGILTRDIPLNKSVGCQWPTGEPRQPGFRFCDEPRVGHRPYCGRHMALAYYADHAGKEGDRSNDR